MNSHIDALAQRLGQAKATGSQMPGSIQELPKFLSTKPGREAVRGAVDSVVARYNVMGEVDPATHKTIIKTLMSQMGMGGAE